MITCLCMYHGRNWWLREAVECFKRQRIWQGIEAELLILNDMQEQVIYCDVPGVRVLNLEYEIKDQSHKQNLGVKWSYGDWVALWDDDDICLPDRLADASRHIHDFPHEVAFAYRNGWYMENGVIKDYACAPFYGAAFYRRSAYMQAGAKVNKPPDQSAWHSIKAIGPVSEIDQAPEECQFVYRWGGGPHDSAIQGFHMTNEARHDLFHKRVMGDPRFKRGHIKIVPGWNRDYIQDVGRELDRGWRKK